MDDPLSGTGYLISEFLSPLTNQRTDEYGGDFEQRMRFGLEVADEVRSAVGESYPVMFRINGNEFMPGGLRRTELQEYAARPTRDHEGLPEDQVAHSRKGRRHRGSERNHGGGRRSALCDRDGAVRWM